MLGVPLSVLTESIWPPPPLTITFKITVQDSLMHINVTDSLMHINVTYLLMHISVIHSDLCHPIRSSQKVITKGHPKRAMNSILNPLTCLHDSEK